MRKNTHEFGREERKNRIEKKKKKFLRIYWLTK